jgi:hypothetical protein
VTTSAPFIAKRLLSTGDLEDLAWGATHLLPEALGARRQLTRKVAEGSRSRAQSSPQTPCRGLTRSGTSRETTRDGLAAIGACDTRTGIPRRRHRHFVHLGHRVSHYLEFFNHRNAIDHAS